MCISIYTNIHIYINVRPADPEIFDIQIIAPS